MPLRPIRIRPHQVLMVGRRNREAAIEDSCLSSAYLEYSVGLIRRLTRPCAAVAWVSDITLPLTQVPNYTADAFFTAINLSLHRATCTHQSTHLEIELC
jgi:hypothetical protein